MIFLVTSTCNDPGLASILQAVKKILLVIQIIAPILLLVMASIHLTNLLRNPDDKKALPKLRNSFIAAAVVFLIPTIVNAAMYMLGNNFTLSDCWNSSSNTSTGTTSYVDPYEGKRQKIGITDPSQYQGGKKQSDSGTNSGGTRQNTSNSNGGRNTTGSSSSSEIGNTTQTGKYYPPLEGSGFRISRASQTGGCSNASVVHDLSISVGNKIYAGMDGELQYIQYVCDGVLYSYGNQARLTDTSTGTYILYGHLSKFVGADETVTKTCHEVYGKNASCGAGACSSGVKKNVILKKTVKKGELIGYTGNTGNSEGPHLHVEIHEGGSKSCVYDPYAAFGMR